jgi:hypothetical protein
MLPADLKPESFHSYPPLARAAAVRQIAILRRLPLSILPLVLRELTGYDWKFPAERKDLDDQFVYLSGLPEDGWASEFAPFIALKLSSELESLDWVGNPAEFSEQLTKHLWATHQIDAFRAASVEYVHKVNAAKKSAPLPMNRLSVVVLGDGVIHNTYPLFRKLRPQGIYFTGVKPEGGLDAVLAKAAARATAHGEPFAHWYIDGGMQQPGSSGRLTEVSYASLEPIRNALLAEMRKVMQPGGGGPERLRSMLAQMTPAELGLSGDGDVAVLNRFRLALLTEGSGTQLFSTTFVQWAAREALRRAQPLTMVARFRPRRHEQSMHEVVAGQREQPIADPLGALVDADMGAYYTWINLQRLPGDDKSVFVAWFENRNEAVAVGPGFARGGVDGNSTAMKDLLLRAGV